MSGRGPRSDDDPVSGGGSSGGRSFGRSPSPDEVAPDTSGGSSSSGGGGGTAGGGRGPRFDDDPVSGGGSSGGRSSGGRSSSGGGGGTSGGGRGPRFDDDPVSGGGSSGGRSFGRSPSPDEVAPDTSGGGRDTTGGGGGTAGGGRGPRFDDVPAPEPPEPEPAPEPVDTIRDRIGGAVDDIGDTVTGVGSDVVDRGADAVADAASEAEVDRSITTSLTRGGVLSETPSGGAGLLPGQVGGFDVSEQRLQDASETVDDRLTGGFDDSPELTIAGSDLPDRAITGAAETGADVLNVPGHVLGAETATEVATSAPGVIAEEGAGDVAATAAGVGAAAAGAAAESARENPAEFAGGVVFGFVAGAGAGRTLGKAARGTRARVRTAGGTKIDADELASEDVIRYAETDGAEGQQFPGADDPALYQSDPADAVRQQADANTPAEIDEVFGGPATGDSATLTKALDTEPDGPAPGRADTGFSSAPAETAADFAYETPGSFFGPELSPNFLRTGGGGASFSLRPGLPDIGNRPTGVIARTDVETPDADTLDEFNAEMIDRRGDTTAVTKPADEVNPGEIEAVVPPGAEFAPVGSGGARGALQRFGVGSDFYTEIGGRRVPLRTVAPADRTPDGPDAGDAARGSGAVDDAAGGVDDAGGAPLDSYVESPGQPVDRPVPILPGASDAVAESDAGASPDPAVSPPGYEPLIPGSTVPGAGGSGGAPPSRGGGSPPPTSTPPSGGAGGSGGGSPGGTGLPGSDGTATGSPPPAVSAPGASATIGSPGSSTPGGGEGAPMSDPLFGSGVSVPDEPQRRRRRDDGGSGLPGRPPGGSPFGSAAVSSPTSDAPPRDGSDPVTNRVFGTPTPQPDRQRRRRRDDDGERDRAPDPGLLAAPPRDPETVGFSNPVAGVFSGSLFGE